MNKNRLLRLALAAPVTGDALVILMMLPISPRASDLGQLLPSDELPGRVWHPDPALGIA